MGRPTVHDLARHAKVSLATVDRVLNGRPGVREQTVERVKQAIADLGYTRDVNAASLARKKPHRFVYLVPQTETQFMDNLIAAIRDTASSNAVPGTKIEIVQAPMQMPQDVSAAIETLDAEAMDGLAIMAPETPTVRDAVIKLRDRGVEVIPFISDLPGANCGHFVGINNVAAGRTAAGLLGRFCCAASGRVAFIGGHSSARDGIDRRFGFDQVMGDQFPHLNVLPTAEGRDQADRVEDITARILARRRDLRAIYLASAGTRGLYRALRSNQNQRPATRPMVIAHELTPISRQALEEGFFDAVIAQDPGHIVRSTVRVLRARLNGVPFTQAQERIRIEIYTRDNLPTQQT